MADKIKKPKEKVESANLKKTRISNLIIAIVVVMLVMAIAIFMMKKDNSQEDVAAIVNGEIITISELNKAFDSLPQQYVGTVSKTSLLNQIIQLKVFYQEAQKQGLTVSNEEARQQFQLAKLSSGLTEEQFSANLAAQNLTEEELIEQYAKQSTIQKFIDENFLSKIQISDEEIENYYSGSIAEFKVDEGVTVKHILIGDENLTAEEKDEKAKELLPQITVKNFCDFVRDYSADKASISSCGEYTFTPSDSLVEEFKQFSFKQPIGKIGTVKTQFGTHIIWTVKKSPARTLTLEEVREPIINFLKSQKGREQYNDFYLEVSKDSKIEIKFKET